MLLCKQVFRSFKKLAVVLAIFMLIIELSKKKLAID